MQTPEKYNAVIKAIDGYADSFKNNAPYGDRVKARAAILTAIDEWAAARDAEIRREEREACARLAERAPAGEHGIGTYLQDGRNIAWAIRNEERASAPAGKAAGERG